MAYESEEEKAKKRDKLKLVKDKGGNTDWGATLAKLPGMVNDLSNPHDNCVRITRSPSVGFTFANNYGLPRGFTVMWYGIQKGGKSLGVYETIGALHEDSPTAHAYLYSPEHRGRLQLPPHRRRLHGIDDRRFHLAETNRPEEIFDVIERDVDVACREGLDLQFMAIDSLSAIQGRRTQENDSVLDYTIGDHAQTIQIGLGRILPVIRKHNIALALIVHVRAEMDQQVLRTKGRGIGGKVKPQASWAAKHFSEYFLYSEPDETKDAQEGLRDESVGDMQNKDKGETRGSKMRVLMKETSCGPRGRMGTYAFDSYKGIVMVNQEIFELANARLVIETHGSSYKFDGRTWKGKDAAFEALEDRGLQKEVMAEMRRRDAAGVWDKDEFNLLGAEARKMDERTATLAEAEVELIKSGA